MLNNQRMIVDVESKTKLSYFHISSYGVLLATVNALDDASAKKKYAEECPGVNWQELDSRKVHSS